MKHAGWWIGFLIAVAFAYAVDISHVGVGLPFVIGALQSSQSGLVLGLIWASLAGSDGTLLLMRLAVVLALFHMRFSWPVRPCIYGCILAFLYGIFASDLPSAIGLTVFTYMVIRSGERKLEDYLPNHVPTQKYRITPKPARQKAVALEHRPFDIQ